MIKISNVNSQLKITD